eukprot:SAG11_NODE_6170_length_1372_cov_1.358995_1_plen_96_part_10
MVSHGLVAQSMSLPPSGTTIRLAHALPTNPQIVLHFILEFSIWRATGRPAAAVVQHGAHAAGRRGDAVPAAIGLARPRRVAVARRLAARAGVRRRA